MAGSRNAQSVPARISSSTLLTGSSASPKPASTMRFCAVRLSIGMTSDVLTPTSASPRSRAAPYGSRVGPGRSGNVIHRSPASAPTSMRRARAKRWYAEHTGTIGSWWIVAETRSGSGSGSYRSPSVTSPRRTSALTSALSAVRSRKSTAGWISRTLPLAHRPRSNRRRTRLAPRPLRHPGTRFGSSAEDLGRGVPLV